MKESISKPAPSQIVGVKEPDTRDCVYGSDLSKFPYNCLCYIRIYDAQGYYRNSASGWLVGPKTVITAGHAVYDATKSSFYPKFEVWVGSDGVRPGVVYGVKGVDAHPNYKSHIAIYAYDYGYLELDAQVPNSKWMTMLAASDQILQQSKAYIAGYPKYKDKELSGKLFVGDGSFVASNSDLILQYDTDTSDGQSGSPVWIEVNGEIQVVGIHTNNGSNNFGIRITDDVIGVIKNWSR